MSKNSTNKSPSSLKDTKYLIPLAILILIGTVIAIIAFFKPDNTQLMPSNHSVEPVVDNTLQKSEGATNPSTDLPQTPKTFVTGLESLPASLQGTDVDGEIIIDENKQLVVTEGLRRLFDYFLTTQGEEEIATIIQRVESYIRHNTPEPASTQAIAIFRQYLAYLNAITDLENSYSNFQMQATKEGKVDLNLISQRKQDLNQLRKKFFDQPTISAFFDSEDEYDDYSMAMMQIDTNESLDEKSKEVARQDYISRMPENDIKMNLEQQDNLETLMERTESLKARGASAEELYSLRRELFGAPAAARLAQVDVEDKNFDQRFKQYQLAKSQLLQQGLSQSDTQLQIKQLEQQLFNEIEQKRLKGYGELQKLEQQNSP